MADPIVTAWQTHCRLSSKFWDAIPAALLECKPTVPGRSIGQMLAHIHNNRLNWLEPLAPDLARSVPKIPKECRANQTGLRMRCGLRGKRWKNSWREAWTAEVR